MLALEQRVIHVQPVENISLVEKARRIGFVLAQGADAKRQLDADAGTIDPERRAALTDVLDAAKRIASLMAQPGNGNQLQRREEVTRWQHQ